MKYYHLTIFSILIAVIFIIFYNLFEPRANLLHAVILLLFAIFLAIENIYYSFFRSRNIYLHFHERKNDKK